MNFLDVKTDYAFKKVFGSETSKKILISFLKNAGSLEYMPNDLDVELILQLREDRSF